MIASILLQSQSGGGMSSIFMIIAMVAIFYFFMIRPQNKKQKEIKQAREALGKGDKVVTAGGIHGKIREVKGDVVSVEIAPNVTINVDKASIYPAPDAAPAKGASKKEESKKESDKKEDKKAE